MRSARRSSIVLAGAMIVAGLASCGTDAPTSPAAAGSAALERSNSFITLAFPGSIQSQAWGIDPSGRVVVGAYRTEDDAVHGFVFARGAFTTIDYPGAAFSIATGINGRGEIVGWCEDANGIQHGYVQRHGVFATVDVPDAPSTRIPGSTPPATSSGPTTRRMAALPASSGGTGSSPVSSPPGRIVHRRERHFVVR